MVNFSKLDTNALIEAAVTPSTSQPKQQPKTLAYYTPEEPKPSETTSRKHNRRSDQKRLSEDSISGSDSSADTFVTGPSKKKQKQPVNDSDEDYDIPRRQIRSRGKSHAFTAKQISDDNYGDEDDTSDVSYVESPKPKVPFASRKTSTPSHKASTTSKPRKALGTRVPTRLEDAHPADKELFRMKTDGKPWKQIKPVWEKLMGKLTGASTLSVRYCKMRENFEKVDGNDVSLSSGVSGSLVIITSSFYSRDKHKSDVDNDIWSFLLPPNLTILHTTGHAHPQIQGQSRS